MTFVAGTEDAAEATCRDTLFQDPGTNYDGKPETCAVSQSPTVNTRRSDASDEQRTMQT